MSATILLVEDNENNRYLLTFLLERHGYRVVHAGDGPSAITLAAGARPALILLDIQLPGMNGYEVARRLRADPALAAVPLVAVTSFAMAGDRERAFEAGCDGYLEKPIDPRTFVGQVEAFLDGAQRPASDRS